MLTDALKHYAKILLRRPDAKWPFLRLQERIPAATWDLHRELLSWARDYAARSDDLEAPARYAASVTGCLIRRSILISK